MEKQRRFNFVAGFLSDLGFLVWVNARHYSHAILGFGLRLDPDFPKITRFLGKLITDSVLEYRSYALVGAWAVLVGGLADYAAFWFVVALWGSIAFHRARLYRSSFEFWGQAWKESPRKARVMVRYAEEVMGEIERRMKAGASFDDVRPLSLLAERLVDDITKKRFNPVGRLGA
jgi:hypothetical protein